MKLMDLYLFKTFFSGLIWGEGAGQGLFSWEFLLWVKTEYKICWTYELGKVFMTKVKRMWKYSKIQ